MIMGTVGIKNRTVVFLVALAIAVNTASQFAQATPFIRIGSYGTTSWSTAISSGDVNPINAASFPTGMTTLYDTLISAGSIPGVPSNSTLVPYTSVLTPIGSLSDATTNPSGTTTVPDALVMSWGAAQLPADQLVLAAWGYTYQSPENFVQDQLRIGFSINLVPGVTSLSMTLVDANGNSKSFVGNNAPSGLWSKFSINPLGGLQGPFNLGFSADANFDATNIRSIILDETWRGVVETSGPLDPTTGLVGRWNSWDSLDVTIVPEIDPATGGSVFSLVAGVLAMIEQRRRRGAASTALAA
jgi:hypothetical protein